MNPAMIDGPVWVTGGAGFIGSHLVDELLGCGLAVTVLDNFSSGDRENLPESDDHLAIKTVDLRDPDGLQRQVKASRPAAVFHLAAHASVPGSIDDPAYDYHSNAVGSFNLLDALRRHGPETVCVLASSGAVYGEPTQFPIAESQPMRPISPYGYSKQSAEQIARMFHDMYGLDVRIARIFNTYGPWMPRFVALDFLKKLDADPRRLEILGSGQSPEALV